MPSLEQALLAALMYGVAPLWALAGFADWLCHRRMAIECNAGVGESLLHLLMLALLGPALLGVLLLEVTALLLVLLLLAVAAHEVVFWCDLFYASARRRIPPLEQWVHGLQYAVPWVGLAGLALLHRDQVLAQIGIGAVPADWSLHLKAEALPPAYVIGALLVGTLLVGLPFVEELARCRRVAVKRVTASAWPPSGRTPRPTR